MAMNPEEMAASMFANLKDKTGKSLAEWLKITRKAKLEKHGQLVKLLKEEHGMTHGFANLVARETLQPSSEAPDDEALVAAQYSGPKEGLRPIYEALIRAASQLGDDVVVSPKKAYVSLRRTKQFALVQPSTRTRVDLGLNLGDEPTSARLEASGSFNQMVSHRVRLGSQKDVDGEVKKWLKEAYRKA